jgi:hypothetical protein
VVAVVVISKVMEAQEALVEAVMEVVQELLHKTEQQI